MLFSSGRSAPQWIICFLGNPGSQYARTRHNAGWIACELLEEETRIRTDRLKFHAFTGVGSFGGSSVLFMRPQTYMNLSGDAVQPAAAFYKIPPERVIVIQDDIALPPGKLRVKRGGSDGGHNGIKSITQRLGTQDYPRIKIGVGAPPHPDYDVIDWVIGRITEDDMKCIREAAGRALKAAEEIVSHGVDSAMNKFNHG
jgi:PTH1 family peptidyl-tRNA hydrolase